MRAIITIMVVTVVSAASWFGWFGWDDNYQIDPKTGIASGPYEAWQGVGSGIMVVFAVLIAVRFAAPVRVAVAAGIGYAIAWGSTEMPGDETGMSGVGLIMILIGVFAGTFVVGSVADVVWKHLHKRPSPVDGV